MSSTGALPTDSKRRRTSSYGFGQRAEKQRGKKPKIEQSTEKETAEDGTLAYIYDGGAHTIKAGLSSLPEPKIIPNCIMKVKSEKKRLFIGNQIDDCRDLSGLYFLLPCERGYIIKWEVQKPIWDYVFSKNICPFENKPVVMTQPLFNFKSIQDCIDEIFFEEYEVKSMYRTNGTDLARYQYITKVINADEPCIIVDSGFSFTHVVPYIGGKKYFKAIKRINVGGKFLTNYLRDIISYRMYDVMDETYVINQVKEDTTFVSQDIKKDLEIAKLTSDKNTIVRNYVLPDFNMIRRGYIQDPNVKDDIAENCQILRLNNERFTVPELLFQPKDIGMSSIGVAEAVAKSILSCPKSKQAALAKNVVIVGGNATIPGFKERLYNDVRSLLPHNYPLNIYKPENPITFTWSGGKSLTSDPTFKDLLVTKEEYDELGASAIQERFNDWTSAPDDPPPKKVEIKQISYIEHIKRHNIFGKEEKVETIGSPDSGFRSEPDLTRDVLNDSSDSSLKSVTPEEGTSSQWASEDEGYQASTSSVSPQKNTRFNKNEVKRRAYYQDPSLMEEGGTDNFLEDFTYLKSYV